MYSKCSSIKKVTDRTQRDLNNIQITKLLYLSECRAIKQVDRVLSVPCILGTHTYKLQVDK
jgi:hypothetical protein